MNRRQIMLNSMHSAMALSLRSVVTGLPASFLLNRTVHAQENRAKVVIFSNSAGGEGSNVNGPGTYESDTQQHPQEREVDRSEVGNIEVNGTTLTAADLENGAAVEFGSGSYRMARAWRALSPECRQHFAWFNHSTLAGIHPEHPSVLKAHGKLAGLGGRGAEQCPSAIAQETYRDLDTTTKTAFVVGGGGMSDNGTPLSSVTPTQCKTLAASVGMAAGGPENFGRLYDRLIDSVYGDVKRNGTKAQLAHLDRHASSRKQAAAFGEDFAELIEGISDDSIDSQLMVACAVAKLRLAPCVVTGFSFGGDNHGDSSLTDETSNSLRMIRSLDTYWKYANSLGILGDTLYSTLTVFGRDFRRGTKGGRGHNGKHCTGLIIGQGVRGGVVGGINYGGSPDGEATGINSADGSSRNPDIAVEKTLISYYKTVMSLAGVSDERCDARAPEGKIVRSLAV